jgi:hypothetical protein
MLPSWVSSWCYQEMLDWTGKFLPGANILAYLASPSATKKKSFITLTPDLKCWQDMVSPPSSIQGKPKRQGYERLSI